MKTLLYILVLAAICASCQHQPTVYSGQYPDNVAAIINNKCATAGCHNSLSYLNAGGLRMDSWGAMMQGGSSGAVLIPYSTGNSSLLYFINTDSSLGPVLKPQMPLYEGALSKSEYETIYNWVAAGAPDKTGNIPFASDPDTRQKIYITQQGCDLIAVIDAQTNVIMRYIRIGMSPAIEVPHCVRFSPDGKYAYVSFNSGQYFQKIDVASDAVISSLYIGQGAWNMLKLSPDGTKALIADMSPKGKVKYLDVVNMQVLATYDDEFVNPHGIAATPNFDTFFITSQIGNTIYRFTLNGIIKPLSLDSAAPNLLTGTYDPHEIVMSPDFSRYFVTCQTSNEVRVMDPHTNKLIKAIKVGTYPQEIAVSRSMPYMFVSCQEDVTPDYPDFKGSIYVINYNTLEIVKVISGPFYQIHGVILDDRSGLLYIASRNILVDGPAPHHTSECGGRNGYYNVYDMHTFGTHDGKRYEATVDPYSADVRFK